MTLFTLGLLAVFIMNIVANILIPVPLTPTMLWLGHFHHPFLTIAVSTLGTIIGWLIFHPHVYRLVEAKPQLVNKIPKTYFSIFGRHTVWWVFIINALPFPLDFIRFIAAAKKEPPLPLTVAIGAGRLIRNSLLVFLGAWLSQYQSAFWAAIAFLFLMPLLAAAITKVRHYLQQKGQVEEASQISSQTASPLSVIELELDPEHA